MSSSEENSPVNFPKTIREYDDLKNVADQLVVVKYSAKWCFPCKKIQPYFEELANTYISVVFMEVDVDRPALEGLVDKKDVSSLPTFKFFRNGILLHKFSGASRSSLAQTLEKYTS